MAYQAIDLGTRGNNLTGNDINEGGVKINANFVELYTSKLDSIIGGTNVTIDNTDPINPIINVPTTATSTSDLTNDGSDGTSTYVEQDELGTIAFLNQISTNNILDQSVTLAKMANASAFSIIGNNTASVGAPLYLTTTEVRALLNVQDGAAPNQTLSLTGSDLTISGGNTVTLPSSGGGVTVDTTIQNGSTNPVENNAIYDALVNINAFVATGNIQADKLIDGSGSGLDADLLDGIQGTNYARTDIDETFEGVVSITGGNDYPLKLSGSGSSTSNIVGIQLYESDNSTLQGSLGFTNNTDSSLRLKNEITGQNIQVSGTGGINGIKFWNGTNLYNIWHAGNDGAGSALDADLLDGVQGSSYLRSDVNDTYSADLTLSNGSQLRFGTTGAGVNPTGLKIQHNTASNVWFDMGLDLMFRDYNDLTTKVTIARTTGNITTVGSLSVADQVYSSSWNNSLQVPTKNAVYDKIESLAAPSLATVLTTGNSAGANSINMNGQNITNAGTIASTSSNFTTVTSGTVVVNDDAYAVGWNGSLQVPTKNALYDKIETLAPYEDGSFTVGISGETSGSYTIGSQSCNYVKLGKLVTFTISLSNVNGTTPTGNLQVTGLPYTCSTACMVNVLMNGSSVNFYSLQGQINTTRVLFNYQNALDGSNNSTMANVDLTSAVIRITGSYLTA